jgi:hypothetical protein
MRRSAQVTAMDVRLHALGARTHANWVFFRLPFDTTARDRVRNVELHPHAARETAVGAYRLGGLCVRMPSSGSVETWARYTTSGISATERFAWNPSSPTNDPTVLGINVPTRVANHVACGGDAALTDPSTWTLDVAWDER